MKKLTVYSLANLVMLTGLLTTIIFFYPRAEKINFPTPNNHQKSFQRYETNYLLIEKEMAKVIQFTKQNIQNSTEKFIPGIKLNAIQASTYRKTNPERTKLLNTILKNDDRRNKFKYVMKKAQELNLPRELALIPVIESEYKNKAISSKGAGGLWQLMPGTAKIFGLSKKQRFETGASTKAALLHLKDLYHEYGNWELAIAAYNAGDGKVNKALRKNPGAKTVQELKLPRETRNYVLAFFQLQKVLKSYDQTLKTNGSSVT